MAYGMKKSYGMKPMRKKPIKSAAKPNRKNKSGMRMKRSY